MKGLIEMKKKIYISALIIAILVSLIIIRGYIINNLVVEGVDNKKVTLDDLRLDRYGNSKIDWVDCIQVNDVKYYSSFDKEITDLSNINEEIGSITFNVAENVGNPNYKFRNGDATYLQVGTKIYSTKLDGQIAALINEEYVLYKDRQ